jgi:TP901 family phage tail tape measure protein
MNQEQLHYRVTGDAKGFKGAINQSQKSLNGFQQQIKSVASNLKLLMSGALVAAGIQAVRSAKTFDKSMTQIKSLVGVASAEVDKMAESVKDLARDTGISANEAGEALFFITSAGLKGADAMQVLEASMKAAKVGLGETKTVADLATSALNAYGIENLSATEATDVLVASVREGKLEASELAQSMGRVLPVASQMGVQFHEIGAAFASMSRTGTNAAEASTAIRGILISLLKPTKQGEERLEKMGLSFTSLRKELKDKGLLSLLDTLKDNFGDNAEAQADVFGNSKALVGIMDLLGKNIGGTRTIFDKLTRSVGATNTAFEITAESSSSEFDKALVRISTTLLELGEFILPKIATALEFFAKALDVIQLKNLRRELDDTKDSAKALNDELSKVPIGANAPQPFQIPDLGLGDKPIIPKETTKSVQDFADSLVIEKEQLIDFTELESELSDYKSFRESLNEISKQVNQELSDDVNNMFEAQNKKRLEQVQQVSQQMQQVGAIVQQHLVALSDQLINSLGLANEGIQGFIKNMLKLLVQLGIQQFINAMISKVVSKIQVGTQFGVAQAGAIASATNTAALMPGGFFALPGMIAAATSIVGTAFSGLTAFAEGGIVTGPTMGLVGEAGAEAIIPLDRLPQLMQASQGKQVGEFTLRGQDLILALERSGDFRARVTG